MLERISYAVVVVWYVFWVMANCLALILSAAWSWSLLHGHPVETFDMTMLVRASLWAVILVAVWRIGEIALMMVRPIIHFLQGEYDDE